MSKKAARRSPEKPKHGSVMMAFRFRPEFARAIRKIAKRLNKTQVSVVEHALGCYGKEIKL